jgi:DNA-directed RNA polymerase subunit H (RpoH/RPB5)
MSTSANKLYSKYQNILVFAGPKYRNFTLDEGYDLDRKTFVQTMQLNEYLLVSGVDNASGKKIYLLLIKPGSDYGRRTEHMKRIFKTIKPEPCTVFIFTKTPLTVYIRRALKLMTPITYKNYFYKHFVIPIEQGPLCSRFKVLSEEETQHLCRKQLFISSRLDLPRIYLSDPQVIWVGAEIGQVVKILTRSLIAGMMITYRVVYPEKDW